MRPHIYRVTNKKPFLIFRTNSRSSGQLNRIVTNSIVMKIIFAALIREEREGEHSVVLWLRVHALDS